MKQTVQKEERQVDEQRLLNLIHAFVLETYGNSRKLQAISPQTFLVEDLGIDSISRMELLVRIENSLGLSADEQLAMQAVTIDDLASSLRLEGESIQLIRKTAPEKRSHNIPLSATTLLQVLDFHADNSPSLPHLICSTADQGERTTTFSELRLSAKHIASALLEKGIAVGDRVALMFPTGEDFFTTFFGVLYAGAVPVPIYPPNRITQLRDHLQRQLGILKNAGAKLLITVEEGKRFSPFLSGHLPELKALLTVTDLVSDRNCTLPQIEGSNLGLIQYTSGSTGDPKGVMLTHNNLLANIRSMGKAVKATPDDVFVSWLPLYHDMGLIGAWLGPMHYGAKLVVISPMAFLARPIRWLRLIHQYRGTMSAAPNFAYEICASKLRDEDLQGLDLSSWRVAFNGAEPVSPQTIQSFCSRFSQYGFKRESMCPVYGLAENCVGLSFPPLTRGPIIDCIDRKTFQQKRKAAPIAVNSKSDCLRFPSCGNALPDHEIRIVDENLKPLSEREEGQIQFRGPSTTSGYFNNPSATEKLFDGDWINSGDYGYLANGEVFVTGRIKDLIIRGGRNIYPAEIEFAVGNIKGIRKGCVAAFGIYDGISGSEQFVIAAEAREANAKRKEELTELITQTSLEILSVAPDVVHILPPRSIPKTSSGKIRRSEAKALFQKGVLGRHKSVVLDLFYLKAENAYLFIAGFLSDLKNYIFTAYAFSVYLILAIPTWIAVVLMPGERLRRYIAKYMGRLLFFVCGVRLKVSGLNKVDGKSPQILVVNHASYLDSLALMSVLPIKFTFVAKSELLNNFILGVSLKRLGTLFVERFDAKQSVDDFMSIKQLTSEGKSLIFFPEATFRRDPGLLPFRMGAFVTAVENSVPLLPAILKGTRDLLPAGRWTLKRTGVHLTIFSSVTAKGETNWEKAASLKQQARETMLRHINEPDLD